jgi:hypothetical protein
MRLSSEACVQFVWVNWLNKSWRDQFSLNQSQAKYVPSSHPSSNQPAYLRRTNPKTRGFDR